MPPVALAWLGSSFPTSKTASPGIIRGGLHIISHMKRSYTTQLRWRAVLLTSPRSIARQLLLERHGDNGRRARDAFHTRHAPPSSVLRIRRSRVRGFFLQVCFQLSTADSVRQHISSQCPYCRLLAIGSFCARRILLPPTRHLLFTPHFPGSSANISNQLTPA